MIILLNENGEKIAETESITPINPFLRYLKDGYAIQKKADNLWCVVAADRASIDHLLMVMLDGDAESVSLVRYGAG